MTTHRFIFIALALISCILLLAIYGKWFYPAPLLSSWERGVASGELIFLAGFWLFRSHPLYWLFSALIFASWGGYALFWYTLHLPCYCMGELLNIPTLLTLSIDGILILLSFFIARHLNASRRQLCKTFILALLFMATGSTLAETLYTHWIQPIYVSTPINNNL